MIKLAPCILSADITRLGEQVIEAERGGADRIHVDVMDGHFVPNLSLGAVAVEGLRKVTQLPLEVHLMVTNPDLYLEEFCVAGSDSILVHWESNSNLHGTLQHIRALGRRAGVVINPATPAAMLQEVLLDLDQVLVMTVNPGLGAQDFLHSALPKIVRVRQMIQQFKPECSLEVDGGIDEVTAPLAVAAGADVLVAGTSVFGHHEGVATALRRLRTSANSAVNGMKG